MIWSTLNNGRVTLTDNPRQNLSMKIQKVEIIIFSRHFSVLIYKFYMQKNHIQLMFLVVKITVESTKDSGTYSMFDKSLWRLKDFGQWGFIASKFLLVSKLFELKPFLVVTVNILKVLFSPGQFVCRTNNATKQFPFRATKNIRRIF